MKIDLKERATLKLMVPLELKEAIRQLAEAKRTSMNNIGYLLLKAQLNRRPELITKITNTLNPFKPLEEILPKYRQVVSAYSTLILVSPTDKDLFIEKSARFIKKAQEFVQSLKFERGYVR